MRKETRPRPALALRSLGMLVLLVPAGAASSRAGCTTDADCEDNFSWCTYNHRCVVNEFVPEGRCFFDVRCAEPFGNCDDIAQVCKCQYDYACDDGLFCSGQERCQPANPAAAANGCVAATNPCQAPCTCNEVASNCAAGGCTPVDADGDGFFSIATGGDDCDDADMNRYPANIEICDPGMHDEDCDIFTLGDRDLDSDGYIEDGCCNTDLGGNLICGTDCDDSAAGVNPGSQEVCNGVDDNCDATIDEGLRTLAYLDVDSDGWGSAFTEAAYCTVPPTHAARAGDCAVLLASVHPGALELCNGIDDDCDGLIDEGYPTPCP